MDDLVAFLRARLDEDAVAATPGRRALDDLRFSLKSGDPYEGNDILDSPGLP